MKGAQDAAAMTSEQFDEEGAQSSRSEPEAAPGRDSVRHRFERAATSYDDVSVVQKEMAERLFGYLEPRLCIRC